jgi:hypothetical protein
MKRGLNMNSSSRLERWDSRAEWPLAGVAAVFLVLYSVQVLAQPPGLIHSLLDGIMYALWAAFAIDYVARLILADQRTQWFFRHLLDLVIVVIPFLRPLRVLRLVVIVGALQKPPTDIHTAQTLTYPQIPLHPQAALHCELTVPSTKRITRAASRASTHPRTTARTTKSAGGPSLLPA